MAEDPNNLEVCFARAVVDELEEIWLWNASQHGARRADAYLAFLKDALDALSWNYRLGKRVEADPLLRYILIRRHAKGHGHVAVYRVDETAVNVLHIFHTAEDWGWRL